MNLNSLLDGAGKVAAGVGVILGLSYAAGLFKMIGLYSAFSAEWLFESMDVQGFVNEGLPLVVSFFAVTILIVVSLHSLREFKYKRGLMVFFVLLSFVVCLNFELPGYEDSGDVGGYSAAVGVAGSVFLAWLLHEYSQSASKNFDAMSAIGAFLIVLVVAPYLAGAARADVLQNSRDGATEVVDKRNRVIGVLVRYIGGKLLILDCNISGQMWLQEPSPSLLLRRSSGQCRASL